MLLRPGTYFNPQTEIVVVVDDSTSIDQEIFNMEAYEGSDWVRISDGSARRRGRPRRDARGVQTHYRGAAPGTLTETAVEQADDTDERKWKRRSPGRRED